ncbi:MAG: hypothetical protein J3Q66DRAFT_335843 [Benniella sp.]|nr:MAG: hypothetical protein J3Q66DRAFT_335843 [Benniella sp.]
MSFFLPNKLNPQGQKLLTIIIAVPIFVSTSYILYKRVILGEEAHKPPRHRIPVTAELPAHQEKELGKDISEK